MITLLLLVGIAFASVIYIYLKYVYRDQLPDEPPLVPAENIIFGNGKPFKRHIVNFLNENRTKYGDVFTIRILNEHWTFILDPHAYETFSREKNFDFTHIAKKVNKNLFSFGFPNDMKMVGHANQKMNGKYLAIQMESFSKRLAKNFQIDGSSEAVISSKTIFNEDGTENDKKELPANLSDFRIEQLLSNIDGIPDNEEKSLLNYLNITFFDAIFNTLFGDGNSTHSNDEFFNAKEFQGHFELYNKIFPFLNLGIPRQFFRTAVGAYKKLCRQPTAAEIIEREGVSDYMKFAMEFMMQHRVSDEMIQGHNLLLLHISYNLLRGVFWMAYKLIDDPKSLIALRRELNDAIEAKRSGDVNDKCVDFTLKDIEKMQVLDSFTKEILRWSGGAFQVRKCLQDTKFTLSDGKTVRVRKGDIVSLFPPANHMDETVFENPLEFQYDRFLNRDHYKHGKKITSPLVTHGSLCPGEKISILQMKWFAMTWINTFKTELVVDQKTERNLNAYGHEILPPLNDVSFLIKQREGFRRLNFVNTHWTASVVN